MENPIQRKPVREDIYIKAAQLRMINTPGALIEDRQYELLFKNISLVTGNWNEILNFSNPSNVIIFVFLFGFAHQNGVLKFGFENYFRMKIQHLIGIIKRRSHH